MNNHSVVRAEEAVPRNRGIGDNPFESLVYRPTYYRAWL